MRLVSLAQLILFVGFAAADPPVNPFGPAPAAAPTAASKTVKAGDVVWIAPGKFADITIEAPAGAFVIWRFYPPVVQRADKLDPGRAIFIGKAGTTYVVTAITIAVDFDKKKTIVTDTELSVAFAGPADPPPKTDPIPDPKPKDPPPPRPVSLYFVIVRADGPADPAFTRVMGLPEWDTLRAAGHYVKDRTVSEAALLGVTVGGQLPAVVTLKKSADDKTSVVARTAVPLPTTGSGILDLPKGVE